MKLPVWGNGLVDQTEKLEPFLMAMPLLAQAKDLAVGCIQRGKQSGCAVVFVVVRHGGTASALQRQAGLGTIEGLNLALLVGAQHQRVLRRIEIQADDVFQFLDEGRIVADLESFHAMRFQPVGPPDAPNAGFADADGRGHGASAPVRGVRRLLARGHGHHTLGQAGTDSGLAAGPGRVFLQPGTPSARKRLRQRETFFGVIAIPAISLSGWPEAANNKMRARSATRTGTDRLRALDSNRVLSSELNVMAGAIRIRERLLYHKTLADG